MLTVTPGVAPWLCPPIVGKRGCITGCPTRQVNFLSPTTKVEGSRNQLTFLLYSAVPLTCKCFSQLSFFFLFISESHFPSVFGIAQIRLKVLVSTTLQLVLFRQLHTHVCLYLTSRSLTLYLLLSVSLSHPPSPSTLTLPPAPTPPRPRYPSPRCFSEAVSCR